MRGQAARAVEGATLEGGVLRTGRQLHRDSARLSHWTIASLAAIVILGVLARCYHIRAPLMEVHAGRQYDTAALARNFYEGSMNILYPQVDWRGDSAGYAEAEFQIYSYIVAVLYRAFGVHEWLGRAVNIAVYAVTALLFFQFVRKLFNETIGLLALLFYTVVPLSFLFTRSFQPDAVLSVASLVGVYYFWLWTEEGHEGLLILSAIGVCVAVLIKPPSLYLGIPILYLAHRKFGWRLFRQTALWMYTAIILIPPVFWYVHAAGLWQRYGNSLFRYFIVWGYPPLTDHLWVQLANVLVHRLVLQIATPAGLPLLAVGFFVRPPQRRYVLHWWAIGFAVYILAAPPNHYGHSYYQLPLVFLAATWMAYGAVLLWERWPGWQRILRPLVLILCLSVVGTSLWFNYRILRITSGVSERVAFGERVRELTKPNALLVFIYPRPGNWRPAFFEQRITEKIDVFGHPEDLYISHRKGWTLDEVDATPELVELLRERGAKYLATFYPDALARDRGLKQLLDRSFTALEVTPKWEIYTLAGSPSARSEDPKRDRRGASPDNSGGIPFDSR